MELLRCQYGQTADGIYPWNRAFFEITDQVLLIPVSELAIKSLKDMATSRLEKPRAYSIPTPVSSTPFMLTGGG